jgi:sulfur carrier protein
LGKTPEPDPDNSGGGNGIAGKSPIPFRIGFFYFLEIIMKIKINGKELRTDRRVLSELLEELNIQPGRVAVEVNLKIIRKSDYDTHPIMEGDNIEIVNFVGGG